MCVQIRNPLDPKIHSKWVYVGQDISRVLVLRIGLIPIGKEPLALYLQMSNMEIGIQEVFCVECVVCVTLIRGVKC